MVACLGFFGGLGAEGCRVSEPRGLRRVCWRAIQAHAEEEEFEVEGFISFRWADTMADAQSPAAKRDSWLRV